MSVQLPKCRNIYIKHKYLYTDRCMCVYTCIKQKSVSGMGRDKQSYLLHDITQGV